jgi:hypothetical protein
MYDQIKSDNRSSFPGPVIGDPRENFPFHFEMPGALMPSPDTTDPSLPFEAFVHYQFTYFDVLQAITTVSCVKLYRL